MGTRTTKERGHFRWFERGNRCICAFISARLANIERLIFQLVLVLGSRWKIVIAAEMRTYKVLFLSPNTVLLNTIKLRVFMTYLGNVSRFSSSCNFKPCGFRARTPRQ